MQKKERGNKVSVQVTSPGEKKDQTAEAIQGVGVGLMTDYFKKKLKGDKSGDQSSPVSRRMDAMNNDGGLGC